MSERDRPSLRGRPLIQRRAASLLAALVAVVCAMPAAAGSTAAQVSFTYGVLAFEEGDDATAAQRFAAAAKNDPDEGTFLHWLALAELRQGKAAEAVTHCEESLAARRPPAAGRARVREDLRLARKALAGGAGAIPEITAPDYQPEGLSFQELPRWEGRVALESGWDSNPNLVAEEGLFALPGETASAGVPSDGAAFLDVEAALHPFYDRRGWSLGLDLYGHQSRYRQVSGLDLAVVEGAASLAWGGDPHGRLEGPLGGLRVPAGEGRLALLLQAGGSWAGLSGDSYLSTVDGAVSLFVCATPAATTRIGVRYGDRDFADEDLPLLRPSGRELAGDVEQRIFLGRADRSLWLAAAAGRYDASRLFALTFREVSAGAAVPLAPRWALDLEGSLRDDDYTHPESSLASPGDPRARARQDTTWRASATATWRAADKLAWSLRASHARRRSNVAPSPPGVSLLDYERTVVSLGVSWRF